MALLCGCHFYDLHLGQQTRDIWFLDNSVSLDESAEKTAQIASDDANETIYRTDVVRILGPKKESASDAETAALVQDRIRAVAQFLVSAGVEAARIRIGPVGSALADQVPVQMRGL